jgi:hypothetical protein
VIPLIVLGPLWMKLTLQIDHTSPHSSRTAPTSKIRDKWEGFFMPNDQHHWRGARDVRNVN